MFRDIFGPLHYGHVLPTKPSLGLYPPRNCSFQGEIDWNRWVEETFFFSCLLSNSTFRVRSFPFSVPLYNMECKEWRKMSLPSVSMRKGLHTVQQWSLPHAFTSDIVTIHILCLDQDPEIFPNLNPDQGPNLDPDQGSNLDPDTRLLHS